jgi:cytosine/uracil/thiamine/allantoin permease
LYDYAWFVGFLVAGAVYLALMRSVALAKPALAGENI